MIDITRANLAFEEYIKNYDIKNKMIKLKVDHIKRVSKIAKQIAINLNLSREDIELAELIGLLHDIGRFEQVKRYNTFWDQRSVSHGLLGVEVLFEDNRIRNFIISDKYDKIIKTAILNHNVARVDMKFSNEKEELHSKIIRDADKIDILHILTYADKKEEWEKEDLSLEKISDKIYTSFMEKNEVIYNQRKTPLDVLVSEFAYIFDFNYKYSLIYIKKEQYIETLYKRFCFKDEETKFRFINIYEKTKSYIDTVIN